MADQKFRQYVKSPGFTIRFAGWTATGGLTGVMKTATELGDKQLHFCAASGDHVKRQYAISDGTVIPDEELVKYYVDPDTKEEVVLSAAQLESLAEVKRTALPKNEMVLTVHPLDQARGQIWPDGDKKPLVFLPKEDSVESIAVRDYLMATVDDFAIMGNVNINGHEGLFRLISWRGHLVLEPQKHTNVLRDWKLGPASGLTEETIGSLQDKFAALSKPFNVDDYVDGSAARVAAVLAAAQAGEDAQELAEIAAAPQPEARDLLAILDDAIAEKVES